MALSGLQEKIFLDRYAAKEVDPKNWVSGQKVVALIAEDPKQPLLRKTIVGEFKGLDEDGKAVVDEHTVAPGDVEYPKEQRPEEMWDRIASAIASVEEPEKQAGVEADFRYALDDFKLVPGGRVMAGSGTDNLTLINCLSGDTLVRTCDGFTPIKELKGKVPVYSQDGYIRVANFKSFGVQNLYEVQLSNGDSIKATAGHQWIVAKPKGGYKRVTTLELLGHRIPVVPTFKPKKNKDYDTGVQHGIVFGDGCKVPYPLGTCEVRLFGEKERFVELFEDYKIVPHYEGKFIAVRHIPDHFKEIPSDDASPSYWYGFIVGLIATDGCCDTRGSVSIHQSDKTVLDAIARNLYKTGFVHIDLRMDRELNPYTGEYAPNYKLQLIKSTVENSDLIKPSHKIKFLESPKPRNTNIEVVAVTDLETVEEVYCCEEPETHSFVVGAGYLTSNCFVLPSPHDSRRGILNSVADMVDIMARGGGVGLNLSSLRPKRAIVQGVNGHSSGAVSWGGMFSYATGLVEQGGSRRGALMLMIWDWHPDLLQFIRAKTQAGAITNANLSVCVSNEFMEAVKKDEEWTTYFPDTTHPAYDEEWDGNIFTWKLKGYPVIEHETYRARDIWQEIVESAWKSAEPGIVFMEYVNQMSNSWYYAPLISTNPCGEQPLPKDAVCNLSAINLSKLYDESTNDVNWDELAKITRIGVRFCDNVTSYTMYPLEAQTKNQRENERRSGLGTMGLAELLIKMGIRYGSEESLTFLDKLFGFIAKEAYLASADLAEEKGSFGKFDVLKYIQSGFMKHLISQFPEVAHAILQKGMRNVTVITQAPTGSTGTMAGTSTGIEPYFAFKYMRKGRLGEHTEYVPIAQDWLDVHPGETLPDYFVTAQDLSPEDHVRVQAVIQKWTDSAISKTANAPHDFTVEQTARLYELAFDLGCKGVTIYRDGSRDIQVLSTVSTKEKEAPKGLEKAEHTQNTDEFESSKVCTINWENGQKIVECGTE